MFWLCKAAIPHLPPGSTIINTSSIQTFQSSPELMDYAMTKGALVNFTEGLATELAQKGIRVNSVAPGPVWTPLIPATLPAEKVGSAEGAMGIRVPWSFFDVMIRAPGLSGPVPRG
jgi:NAD(P)-dependent dehydrogenase (short-subunit alcohol dehydrogenase family)